MSARATCWGHAIIKAGVLESTVSAKLVLLSIADRADESGKCQHSSTSIARGLFISDTTVKTAIKYLGARGVLHIIRRQSEDCNVNLSNLYLLQIPAEFATDALVKTEAEGVGQIPPHGVEIRRGAKSDPGLKRTKIKSKSNHARVAAPADAGAAAAKPVEKDKARRVWPSGLVSWVPADVTQCMRLEQDVPAGELAAAVAAEREASRDPLPGRIAARLLQQRQAAQSAAAAEQVEARTARLDAESRARGERDMQELMALQAHQTTQDRDS